MYSILLDRYSFLSYYEKEEVKLPEKTLEELIEELHERYNSTIARFSADPQAWTNFLSRSCYYFRLRFDQQVLVYAQKPQATIIATSDQWFKMYRPVIAKSDAINVFEDINGQNGRYTRYYEPSDTRVLRKSQPIPFWEMKRGYKGIVTDAFKNEIDDYENRIHQYKAIDFEHQIITAAEAITEREIENYYDLILMNVQDSDLDKLSDDEIIDIYTSAVANSTAYAMLTRLGYEADKVIDTQVFDDILSFNTADSIAVVGTAQQQITRQGLDVIAKAIRNYERDVQYDKAGIQRNDPQRKNRIQHGIVRKRSEDTRRHPVRGNTEGLQEERNGNMVPVQRGASDLRPGIQSTEGRDTSGREILNETQGVSQRGTIPDVRQSAYERRAEQALQRTSEGMHRNGNASDERNGNSRGTEQRASEQGLVEIRAGNAESRRESERDSTERTGLLLTNNQEEKTAENDDKSDSAVSYENTQNIKAESLSDIEFTDQRLARSVPNDSTINESDLFKIVKQYDKDFYLNERETVLEKSNTQLDKDRQESKEDNIYIDVFFHYPDSERIDEVYYNPDGNDGNGQYVTVSFGYDLIKDAAEHSNTPDEFFDYLSMHGETVLDDRGTGGFSGIEKLLAEETPIFRECSEETMDGLIAIAEKELSKQQQKTVVSEMDKYLSDEANLPEILKGNYSSDEIPDLAYALGIRVSHLYEKKEIGTRAQVAMNEFPVIRFSVSTPMGYVRLDTRSDEKGLNISDSSKKDAQEHFYSWEQVGKALYDMALEYELDDMYRDIIAQSSGKTDYPNLIHQAKLKTAEDQPYPIENARKSNRPEITGEYLEKLTDSEGYVLKGCTSIPVPGEVISKSDSDVVLVAFPNAAAAIKYLRENKYIGNAGYGIREECLFSDEQRKAAERSVLRNGTFKIYQLPDGEKYHGIRFESLKQLHKDNVTLNFEDYNLVYDGHNDDLPEFSRDTLLDTIYSEFNTNLQSHRDFDGRSLSVSDVVAVTIDGEEKAYYCDRAGWTEMHEFFIEKTIPPTELNPINIERNGDFFEIYGEDARTAAQLLGLTIIQTERGDMVGFPDAKRWDYEKQLHDLGYTTVLKIEDEEVLDINRSAKSDLKQQLSLFDEDEPLQPVYPKNGPLHNRTDRDKQLLREEIMHGTNVENGKFRIRDYVTANAPSIHDLAKMLKDEHGTSGRSSSVDGVIFTQFDSKGITIVLNDNEKVHYTWNEAAQIVSDLIDKDEYITQKDIDDRIWHSKYTITHTDPKSVFSGDQMRINAARKVLDEYGETAEYQPPKEEKAETDIPETPQKKLDFDLAANPVEIAAPKVRYQRNVEAIKTLKAIQAEGRNATADEQVILSKYVGWGGLSEAFDPSKWANEYKELKDLLTDDEYKAARESTLTAFFTPPEITSTVWKALGEFGFTTGNVIEPSCGIGNFIGMIPKQSKGSRVYAVELDNISAGISQQLYQNAQVFNEGYEKFQVPNNFFDVAVGNVPFGDFKVSDRNYDKYNFLIHDYFFAKTLDKVRPGGIVALVTSQGTLDKENPKVRKYIAQRAELIGAIRLPDNVFKGNAGTDVTSDIIFLQKREKMTEIEPDWVHLDFDENGIAMNSYFVQHPEMIMGEMQMKSGPFGPVSTCRQIEGTDLSAMLDRAIGNMSAIITEELRDAAEGSEEKEEESIPADPNVRENSYTIFGGELYYRENSRMMKRDFSDEKKGEEKVERIKAMLPVRDSLRRLIDLQTNNASDEEIIAEQRTLNDLYDRFVSVHGRLGSRANSLAFYDDHSANLLLSLENYNEKGEFTSKADIFTKRTISPHIEVTSVETAGEALAVTLGEKAKVDMDYMCSLSGKTEDQLYNELAGSVFINPAYNDLTKDHENKYIARDEYLSGNVREKLRQAEYFNTETDDNRFAINIEELKKVIPKDLSPADISAPLGATWIPIEHVNQFIRDIFDIPRYYSDIIKASYSEFGAEWAISGKRNWNNFLVSTVYGTKMKTGLELLEDCLNLRHTKVYDPYTDENGKTKYKINELETEYARDKQENIKQAFEEWIWKDPQRRQELVNLYNEKFNSLVPRVYDGTSLTFAGINPEYTLKEHQRNAIARIVYGGNTLLAHTVGAGKTFEIIAAAQESKRLGLCNKSLIVVPKHLIKQWKNEYMKLYPGANILVATPKDFTKAGRRHFTARIATGDYDAIIITQPQFDKIQLTPEYQKKVLGEEIERITQVHDNTRSDLTVKTTERILRKLQTRFDNLSNSEAKDDMIFFEELGIDRIFVDESQAYKNMYHPSKMTGIPGLANTESKRATGMHMICRYLDEKTDGRGVIFATGTPLANSLSEVYTIMYNLQYKLLEETGMTNFDSWVSTFAKAEVVHEQSFDSAKYNEKLRFTEFLNIPELKRMVFECMDVQTSEMLKLPVPEVKRETILLPSSEYQQDIMESFAQRAENYKNRAGDFNPAEMLMITSDARKMALDQRVYDPILPESETGKTAACADKIVDIYHKTEEKKSTQMVFCDMSTPGGANSKAFCVYEDLKEKLIERGIPEGEIAFIHDADTDEKKDKLFKSVREGSVRVIIGSTQKMGTGTNVQERLIALHHLDCPWRPMDLEQQEGRIIRQGNTNKEVQIYTYVTEGTFDSNMYAQLARKQKAISQFYSPDMNNRSCEDISESVLSYLDVAAITSGNPLILEQAELQRDVTKLQRQRTTFYNEKYALEDKIELEYPEKISRLERVIPRMEEDLETAKANPKTEDFCGITIKGKFYDTRKEAGTALMENARIMGREKIEFGSYRGFKLYAQYSALDKACIVVLRGKNDYDSPLGNDSVGNIVRLDNAISEIEKRLERSKTYLDEYKTEYAAALEKVKEVFPHEEELKEKKARIEQITAVLSKDRSEDQKQL